VAVLEVVELAFPVTVDETALEVGLGVAVVTGALVADANSARQSFTPCAGILTPLTLPE
jgi:hypothetical protein